MSAPTRYRVFLHNLGIQLEAEEGRVLLDVAREAGVELPYQCGHGACLTCAARLKGGRVHQPTGTALSPALLAEHILLTCVARVAGDCWIEVGRPEAPLLPSARRPRWTE